MPASSISLSLPSPRSSAFKTSSSSASSSNGSCKETEIALQICQAGNIRTALMCLNLAVENDQFDRFLIATDTPTGNESKRTCSFS